MPNQQIRTPYGDSFIVGSPHIDQLSNQIYQEQKQRELQQYQDSKAMDNEFGKELANVKKVDIPDVVKAYGDYKQDNIRVMKLGNKATPQDHYGVLEKRANMASAINGSIEDKERLKGYAPSIRNDSKGLYATTAAQTVQRYLNTPTSQRTPENDSTELMNQYSVPDLDKELKSARGTPKDVSITLGQSKTDPLKDDTETYKVGNTPNQFYNSFLTDLVRNNKGQNFAGIMDHQYNDQEKEDLTNKYLAKIADPKFISIYGETQPFNPTAMQTRVGQAAALKTMEEVVNTPLLPSKTGSEINADRAMKARQQFAIDQQKRGAAFSMERVGALLREKRTLDNKDDFDGIANILNNTRDVINSGTPYKDPVGNDDPDVVNVSDFNLLKAFSNIKGYKPDNVTFDKKKNMFAVTYNAKDWTDKDGKPQHIDSETIPVTARDYTRLKVDEMSPKNKGKTNANIDKIITENGGLYNALNKEYKPDATNQTHTKATSTQTYKLGGKEITDDQLKKGAAKYKMSVDQYKKSIGL